MEDASQQKRSGRQDWRRWVDLVLDAVQKVDGVDDPPPDMEEAQQILREGGFYEHLRSEDLVGLLLRTHLWCHQLLQEIIRVDPEFPEFIPDRLSFSNTLALAASTGALHEELHDGLRTLNRIRNRVAHELGAEPNKDDQDELAHIALPLFPKEVPEEDQFPFVLATTFVILVVRTARSLVVRRMDFAQRTKTVQNMAEIIGALTDLDPKALTLAFKLARAMTNRRSAEEE